MIEQEIDHDLLTKRSRKLAWIECFLRSHIKIYVYVGESLETEALEII